MKTMTSSRYAKCMVAGLLVCGLFAGSAIAASLPPSQVANIAVNNYSVGDFLTLNWSSGEQNIGLLQFDLSAYAGKTVGNATLNLYHQYNGTPGAEFDLFQNTSGWSSTISTWSSAPNYNSSSAVALNIADGQAGIWRSVDVTSAINAWTSGSQANYGWTFKRVDQSSPIAYFSATTNIYGGFAPTLSITAVPEPETYAMLLAGLGLMGCVARRRKTS